MKSITNFDGTTTLVADEGKDLALIDPFSKQYTSRRKEAQIIGENPLNTWIEIDALPEEPAEETVEETREQKIARLRAELEALEV